MNERIYLKDALALMPFDGINRRLKTTIGTARKHIMEICPEDLKVEDVAGNSHKLLRFKRELMSIKNVGKSAVNVIADYLGQVHEQNLAESGKDGSPAPVEEDSGKLECIPGPNVSVTAHCGASIRVTSEDDGVTIRITGNASVEVVTV